MSDDLYDSLEDECNNSNCSCDSLDLLQTKLVSFKTVSNLPNKGEPINVPSSFRLKSNADNETDSFSSTKTVLGKTGSKYNFFPTIHKNSIPGLQELFSHSADFETLAKKGLLLNGDGSFTKSASDGEKLPFITREYKNLVFQKKKTYNAKKQVSHVRIQKTKSCSEKESLKLVQSKFIKSKQYLEVLHKKYSFEETSVNFDKSTVANLTDSMKQELQNISQRKTNEKQNDVKLCCTVMTSKGRFLGGIENNTTNSNGLSKHPPQVAQKTQKQPLTYLEQQQLRYGYNPKFLRRGIKKNLSDTTRSNFGDLTTAKLSDVSSRVLSTEDITDSEAEEKFYLGIIKKEKDKAVKAGLSLEEISYSSAIRSESLKDLEKLQLRGSDRSSTKQILKPLSIDIKREGEHATKKCSHYCLKDSPPKMSKVELALKGKRYGYMANARNILKFKSREDKLNEREMSYEKSKELSVGHKQTSELTLNSDGNLRNFLPALNLARKMRSGLEQRSGQSQNAAGLRNMKDSGENEKMFCLPQVSGSEIVK